MGMRYELKKQESRSSVFTVDSNSNILENIQDERVDDKEMSSTSGTQQDQGCCCEVGWTKNQWLTVTTQVFLVTLACVSYSMPITIYSEIAREKQVSAIVTGLFFGSFELVVFIASPLHGMLVSKYGPKPVSMLGGVLCTVCCISFGFLDRLEGDAFIVLSFIVRAVEANGYSMIMVSGYSTLAQQFPTQISFLLGLADAGTGLGFMLGPIAGAALSDNGNTWIPFVTIGSIFAVAIILGLFLQPSAVNSSIRRGNVFSLLKNPLIAFIYIHALVCSMCLCLMDPLLEGYLEEEFKELTNTHAGLLFLLESGMALLASPIIGKLGDKGYLYSIMISGGIMAAVALLIIGPSPFLKFIFGEERFLAVLIVGIALYGTAYAMVTVPAIMVCLNLARASGLELNITIYGMASGLVSSGYSLGAFIGPTIADPVNAKYGFEITTTAFSLGLFVMSLAMIAFVLWMRSTGKRLDFTEAPPQSVASLSDSSPDMSTMGIPNGSFDPSEAPV